MSEQTGEREVARTLELRDPRFDLTGWVVIDSLPPSGRAFGGVRRVAYPSRADAFADARRLARAMSQKCALAELPAGGAKTVLWDRGGRAERGGSSSGAGGGGGKRISKNKRKRPRNQREAGRE